jgi:hypothetical protein
MVPKWVALTAGILAYVLGIALMGLGILMLLAMRIFEGGILLGSAAAFTRIGVEGINMYTAARIMEESERQG